MCISHPITYKIKQFITNMNPANLTILLPFLLIVSSFSSSNYASAERCHPHDKKALLAIAEHFGNSSNFPFFIFPGIPCCDWVGLDCSEKNNRVTDLALINFNLSGTIPPAVGDLLELKTIMITGNPNLVGTIPSSITRRLKKLNFLDLSQNSLSGHIPDNLSHLIYLDLSSNQLTGTIPPSLPKLNNGVTIRLQNNRLVSPLPDFTGFQGQFILLSNNKFTGNVPESLGGLAQLQILDLSYNQFVGDASFLFQGASNPGTEFHLQNNQLKFNLTRVTFPTKMSYLEIQNNLIYGSIPAQINQLTYAQSFNFSYDQLCGNIPQGPVTAKFGIDAYLPNKCLCGKPLPACKSK